MYCSAVKNVLKYEHKRKATRVDVRHIGAGLAAQCRVNTMAVKPNSTPSADSRQLSIFTPHFDERIRRIEIEGVTHFSVLNILPERVK